MERTIEYRFRITARNKNHQAYKSKLKNIFESLEKLIRADTKEDIEFYTSEVIAPDFSGSMMYGIESKETLIERKIR